MQKNKKIKIGGKYILSKVLGKGAFGLMYSGYNLKTNEEVAIKLETLNTNTPMLEFESAIYLKLAGQPGVPNVYWIGCEGEFTVMVMDILGPSLKDLFNFCN